MGTGNRKENLFNLNKMQFSLRRVMKFARHIREVNRATADGGELYGLLQHLGAGVDGLCDALDSYERTQEILGVGPIEGAPDA